MDQDHDHSPAADYDQEMEIWKVYSFIICGTAAAIWCYHQVGGWLPVWPRVAIAGSFLLGGWLGWLLSTVLEVLLGLAAFAAILVFIYHIFTC